MSYSNSSNHANFSRRGFLKTTALGGLAIGASLALPSWQIFAQNASLHINKLKIPPLETGRIENGVKIYDLEIQNGETEFFEGIKTKSRGVNGSLLGPTLRMNNGDIVRLNVKNSIGETTTMHWHGLHLPAKYDGGPHQPIKSGETWSPQFEIMQKAANFWYHPHLMGKTADHVWQGIAGMIIVDDEESKALPLPSEYGIDDIPVILQDRRFGRDGSMEYRPTRHDIMAGMIGDIALTNGTLSAYFEASTNLIRLRLLNGANASIYNLGFSDSRNFMQISTDGSMLEKPFETNSLILSPGERAEIIVDVSDGKTITLENKIDVNSGSMGGGMMGGGSMMGGNLDFKFLEIRPASKLKQLTAIPNQLTKIDWIDEKQAANTRPFVMSMQMGPMMMLGIGKSHTINSKSMKMDRIDEIVKLDTTEIWEISNSSMFAHPFHIHLVQFQIISRNGKPPHAGEMGLKDTVLVHPNETVRFIAKFETYADEKYPFMYHCHILEHEDAGMMGQFLVV